MAAGLGTRLQPFTSIEPKPTLPLMGIPMVQYVLDYLTHFGVRDAILNYHHLPDVFLDQMAMMKKQNRIRIHLSDESKLLLGSAGGIANAKPYFKKGPFLLLNADVLQWLNLEKLFDNHQKLKKEKGVLITLAVLSPGKRREKYREIVLNPSQKTVKGLGEHSNYRPYYSGVAVMEEEAIASVRGNQPSEFVPMILEPALRAGKVGYYLEENPIWMDIGSPELWWKAHFDLIKMVEGRKSFPDIWQRRIEKQNYCLQEGLWVDQHIPESWGAHAGSGYLGWAGHSKPSSPGPNCKAELVLYADEKTSRQTEFNCGIGFKDKWVGFSKNP